MLTDGQRACGVPATTMTALVLAVFTVSVGYGVVLPLLPALVERLLADGVAPSQLPAYRAADGCLRRGALPGSSCLGAAVRLTWTPEPALDRLLGFDMATLAF